MAEKESIDSRRIRVINSQTSDLHEGVSSLNESLVDRDRDESMELIDSIRIKLSILKQQIVNGDIV